MNKKRIISLIVALTSVVCAFLGCKDDQKPNTDTGNSGVETPVNPDENDGNGDDGNNNVVAREDAYTLVVQDGNGNPVADYLIALCTVGEDGEKRVYDYPRKTDENGRAVFAFAKGAYYVYDVDATDHISLVGEYPVSEYGEVQVTVHIGTIVLPEAIPTPTPDPTPEPEPEPTPEPEPEPTRYTITYAIAPQCEMDGNMLELLKMVFGEYPESYEEGVGTVVSDLRSDAYDDTYFYVFVDWYYDEDCTQLCENGAISDRQTGNITLYAKVNKSLRSEKVDGWA